MYAKSLYLMLVNCNLKAFLGVALLAIGRSFFVVDGAYAQVYSAFVVVLATIKLKRNSNYGGDFIFPKAIFPISSHFDGLISIELQQ